MSNSNEEHLEDFKELERVKNVPSLKINKESGEVKLDKKLSEFKNPEKIKKKLEEIEKRQTQFEESLRKLENQLRKSDYVQKILKQKMARNNAN